MKVLHVATTDRGGAGIACSRLHNTLLCYNKINSKLLVLRSVYGHKNSVEFKNNQTHKSLYLLWVKIFNQFIFKKLKRIRPRGLEMISSPFSLYDITTSSEYQEADVIHLHWVAGFLDWYSFFKKNTKPVVWTLHDEQPYLGFEHYKELNLGITKKGNPKIRKISELEKWFDLLIIKIKKISISQSKEIYPVGNSQWTMTNSAKSALFKGFPHSYIDLGIPNEFFNLKDCFECRELLNLPKESIIIMFAADSISNNRKGVEYLVRALKLLEDYQPKLKSQIILLTAGKGSYQFKTLRSIHLGNLDEKRLAYAYNAANVFVIPSIMEAKGMVAVESLLCGTPVIGFPTGGITETIDTGVNGILCEEISVFSLNKALKSFINGEYLFDRSKIALDAQKKHNLEKQAKAYIKLYKEVIDSDIKNKLN